MQGTSRWRCTRYVALHPLCGAAPEQKGWACAQAFGWTRIRGTWYYLDPSTGVVHTGWLKDGDHWYYLTRSGAMVTGARWIDGTRYVFDAQGRLQE